MDEVSYSDNNEIMFYKHSGDKAYSLGNYDEAIKNYIEAFKLNSSDVDVYKSLGNLLYKNTDELIDDVEEYELKSSFVPYIFKNINNPSISYKMLNLFIVVMRLKTKCIYKEDKDVAHYTKLNDINYLIKKDKAKLRLNNVAYMNDPTEGKVFFKVLENGKDDIKRIIKSLYKLNSKDERYIINGDSHTYLSCFSHAIDSLPMWVQYSADATGSCLIFKSSFFDKEESVEIPIDSEKQMDCTNSYCLYNVLYIDEEKIKIDCDSNDEEENINDDIRNIQERILYLKDYELEESEKNVVKNILDQVRFLFKSTDYKHEKEARIIKFDVNNVKITDISDGHRVPHLYINVEKDLDISEVILGPKVTQPEEIATYIKYTGKVRKVTKSKINYK